MRRLDRIAVVAFGVLLLTSACTDEWTSPTGTSGGRDSEVPPAGAYGSGARPAPDDDHDGMCDGDELYAGCDPSDNSSVLAVDGMRVFSGLPDDEDTVVLTWPSASNKTYGIYRSSSLIQGFTRTTSGIPATPPLNTHTDHPPASLIYYRIEVE